MTRLSIRQSVSQSINGTKKINQLSQLTFDIYIINQSFNQPIRQSIKQLDDQSLNQSNRHSINQRAINQIDI